MAPLNPLRSPLALRIYLVGLAQIAAVVLGFSALLEITRPPGGGPFGEQARYVAGNMARVVADRPALEREVARARSELQATVTILDPDGAVLATNVTPGQPRCMPPEPHPNAPRGMPCHIEQLPFPGGRLGRMEYAVPWQPPPASGPVFLALVVVGVSSWLLARTLTRPLGQMSAAARALGEGDLSARVGLARRDELGDVARAFDEMAERVAELLRAEKELLANISHELRTPLARIRVALDLAAEGNADVAKESLAEIAGDLDELERLISDVLTAARLDLAGGSGPAGVPPLRRQPIDAAELLSQAASRFRSAHPERALRTSIDEPLPALDGDPVLLRRVIDNLLENAHKYTEQADAPIELEARGEGGLRIEIVDHGAGIAASDLPHVFRPFFRADRSRARATGGLGLGLALTRRIVEAHGGTILLESELGRGTRARVTLPIEPAQEKG